MSPNSKASSNGRVELASEKWGIWGEGEESDLELG